MWGNWYLQSSVTDFWAEVMWGNWYLQSSVTDYWAEVMWGNWYLQSSVTDYWAEVMWGNWYLQSSVTDYWAEVMWGNWYLQSSVTDYWAEVMWGNWYLQSSVTDYWAEVMWGNWYLQSSVTDYWAEVMWGNRMKSSSGRAAYRAQRQWPAPSSWGVCPVCQETCAAATAAPMTPMLSSSLRINGLTLRESEKNQLHTQFSNNTDVTLQALHSNTLPPNSSIAGYPTEGALLILTHLSTNGGSLIHCMHPL